MKYPKFDLERALAGEPVITRNGMKAYVRHHETQFTTKYPLMGFVCGHSNEAPYNNYWYENGMANKLNEEPWDIVGMWVEPVEFNHWDALLPDIKFIAEDADGVWYGYTTKPKLYEDEDRWDVHWSFKSYELEGLRFPPDVDWRHSLIERPADL